MLDLSFVKTQTVLIISGENVWTYLQCGTYTYWNQKRDERPPNETTWLDLGGHHVKRYKPGRERQIWPDIIHMWNQIKLVS